MPILCFPTRKKNGARTQLSSAGRPSPPQTQTKPAQPAAEVVKQWSEEEHARNVSALKPPPVPISFSDAESIFMLLESPLANQPPAVRLLDSDWLLRRADALEAAESQEARQALALPSRRELERNYPEAFVDISIIKALPRGTHGELPIGSVSHAWQGPAHADPNGDALCALASALRKAQQGELPKQQLNWDGKGAKGYQKLPPRVGIFLAWSSLYQHVLDAATGSMIMPRSYAEEAAFLTALTTVQVWFVHQMTFVVQINLGSRGETRGWWNVEHAWSMIVKPNSQLAWPMILNVDSGGIRSAVRVPPMAPDALERLLKTKAWTAPTVDMPLVVRLYRETFLTVFQDSTFLNYKRSDWGDAEFAILAEGMHLWTEALKINLGDNLCGDQGAIAVATAVKAGALPSVEILGLYRNQLGAAALRAFADAIAAGGMPALQVLSLDGNRATKALEKPKPAEDGAELKRWVEAKAAVDELRAACDARSVVLSTTAQEREEHWQANRLVAKGVGRTEHLEHLAPRKRLQGAFAAVVATNRIQRMLNRNSHRS